MTRGTNKPVGAPSPLAATVAVNVMLCPNPAGFAEEVNVVVMPTPNPVEILSRTITPPTARSGLPSPLKSPTAVSAPPAPRDSGVWKVPSPLPISRTAPLPIAASCLPSPLKSATAIWPKPSCEGVGNGKRTYLKRRSSVLKAGARSQSYRPGGYKENGQESCEIPMQTYGSYCKF